MKSKRFFRTSVKRYKSEQRGVALITMLLLLLLLTALSISMVLAFSSDMYMNGYNRNFRASFYAADAGNAIIRQDISARLSAMLPAALPVGTYPLPSDATTTIVSAINSAYGSAAIPINSTGSFAESFKLSTGSTSLTLYKCIVGYYTDYTLANKTSATNTATSTTGSITCPVYPYAYSYTYTYHYSLTTIGTAQGTGGTAITDAGNVIVTATSADTINSFSQYGTFIQYQDICSAELIGGTITGRQFTNGAWTFGSDQSYIFTGKVESQSTKAGYMFSDGTCIQVAGSSSSHNGSTISPTFQKSYKWGVTGVDFPQNDFNQKSAVITGIGITPSGKPADNPTTAQLTAALKDSTPPNGTYSYSGTTSSGVFIPVSSTTGKVNGGGIYVKGDASVVLSYSGTNTQIYTVKQGTTTTTVTITPTPGIGTTVIQTGTNAAVTYNGVPTQTDPSTGAVSNAAVLYVNGNVTSLSGTIQDNTAITVTAANDIIVTGNLVYKTPVVDANGNETAAEIAAMALTPPTGTQTLGLYTAGGSVYMKPSSDNIDMEVDASIMTTKDNGGDCHYKDSVCDGVLGVTGNNGINKLTIVGGRIQSRAMIMPSGTINKRNVFFDERYNGSFAPPFFPRPTTIINPPQYANTLQRTGWVLQTAY